MTPGADDKKAKRGPLRSSIACLRCRKSKIKCDNRGPTGPCDTCIKTGKDCRYPDQTSITPKRHEPPGSGASAKLDQQQGGSDRKRPRRHDLLDGSRPDHNSHVVYAEDVLSAHYLTPNLWGRLFAIYNQHFLTELPFLHLPTLKEKIGRKYEGSSVDSSHETNLVLLGVLTLTARFEPSLVQYVVNTRSPLPGSAKSRPVQACPDAAAASEYFADALITALGPLSVSMTQTSVERVQAFLMLGLYEWIQSKPKAGGIGAWMYVGLAIRMAQALCLGFGDKKGPDAPQPPPSSSSSMRGGRVPERASASDSNKTPPASTQEIVAREVKRRTMFSCLILDRMLSCGKNRVSTVRSEDLQIRLPCAEFDFDYSTDVTHRFLKDDDDDDDENGGRGRGRSRPSRSDSVLGCFIRLVDIWGEISKYSFAGGRRSEKEGRAPWQPESRFSQLRGELEGFYTDLPEVYRWSVTNFHRHGGNSSGSIFVSLHMLGSLCQIMLHREYIPFIPIRCRGPTGPLDEPTFPDPPFSVPDGFWDESAEHVFSAAKNIVEVIRLCEGNVPQSSLVLFAIWTAAFVGIYAFHFPHMDTCAHMLAPRDRDAFDRGAPIDVSPTGGDATPISTTYQTLVRMSANLKLAGTYVKYFHDMDQYYHRVRLEFSRYGQRTKSIGGNGGGASAPASSSADGRISMMLANKGGGLEEWKVQGSKVINNGAILDADDKPDGSDNPSRDTTVERGSSYGPDGQQQQQQQQADRPERVRTPRSIVSGSFTAINSVASTAAQQQQHEVAPSPSPLAPPPQEPPRTDGDVGWRSLQQAAAAYPLPSPTQSSSYVIGGVMTGGNGGGAGDGGGGSPPVNQMILGTLASIPCLNGGEIMDYLDQTEHMSWSHVAGGPDTLAHGSDSPEIYLGPHPGFWAMGPEMGLAQQIGTYE